MQNSGDDIKKDTIIFEEAMKELEKIVSEMERGEVSLDDSLKLFQRGIELSRLCSKRLDEVENKILVLMDDGQGGLTEKNFKIERTEE